MNILFNIKKTFIFISLLVFLSSCGGKDKELEPTDTKDRKPILTHWVDNIIIPSYANFKVKMDLMVSKSEAFTAKPDLTTLSEFRNAWVDAYIEWQKVELFEVGPGDKYTIRNFFNIYPADKYGIAESTADPSINLEVPSSYSRQGFPALDYLINGVGINDQAIIDYYTTSPDAAKRIAYLKRITTKMSGLLNTVIAEWNGSYRDTFIDKTGIDIGSSTGLVVNSYILNYERYIRSGKFGIPSGAMGTEGITYPDKVEAFYKKDLSLTLAKTAHQASIDFFNGKDVKTGIEGPSFKTYLNALETKDTSTDKFLSEIINTQFQSANSKLNSLSPNLYEAVNTNNQAVKDIYTEMQKVVRMLKVDMTSAMSITITYTDNDGD